jgi:hypothetical protein
MTKELRELIGLKKRLWYKCRHSGFKLTKIVTEYKNLNKNLKQRFLKKFKQNNAFRNII